MSAQNPSNSGSGGLQIRGRAALPTKDETASEKRIPTSPRAGRDTRPLAERISSAQVSDPPSFRGAASSRNEQSRQHDITADGKNRRPRSPSPGFGSREHEHNKRTSLLRFYEVDKRSSEHRHERDRDDITEHSDVDRRGSKVPSSDSAADRKKDRNAAVDGSSSGYRERKRIHESGHKNDESGEDRKRVSDRSQLDERASSRMRDRRNSARSRSRERSERSSRRERELGDDDLERRHRDRYRSRSRSRSRDRERDRDRHHSRRDRKRSYSSSSYSEFESDSESEDGRRRRRKEKRRRDGKEDHRKRKDSKRDKSSKKEKKSRQKATAASTKSWGKYGVIGEGDMSLKSSEFKAWLIEERQMNPDTIPRDKMKKEFAVFVEDYNTATLSHEKYYDLPKYQARMNLIKSGATLPLDAGLYNFAADMKAHKATIDSRYEKPTASLSREEIMELRKIESERIEIGHRRLLGLDIPKYFGVRTEEVDRAALFHDEPMPHGFQS